MNIFLGNLPIELKLNSNQTQVIITPKYFPYDDDFFGKIYYKADQLYLCLEIEDIRHKYVRHRKKNGYYRKKIHTKFWGIEFWEINSNSLNQMFTYPIKQLNWYVGEKDYGFKFKIRATYRYDMTNNTLYFSHNYKRKYNKSRTHIFSNELTLEK